MNIIICHEYNDFLNIKKIFLHQLHNFEQVDKEAAQCSLSFIAYYEKLIIQEVADLSIVLERIYWTEEHALFCYFCCAMLENFYKYYDKPDKVINYALLKNKIRFNKISLPLNNSKFIEKLRHDINNKVINFLNTPRHTSDIKKKIGLLNLCRMYWVFDKLAVTTAFTLINHYNVWRVLPYYLYKPLQINHMINNLELFTPYLKILGISFFAIRLAINLGLIAKHTFSSNKKGLPISGRFFYELEKRFPEIASDAVWGSVMFCSNYILPLSLGVALTAAFLLFDIMLLIWQKEMARKNYEIKKSQYYQEIRDLDKKIMLNCANFLKYQQQCLLIREQLNELEISWQTTQATFNFNIMAAIFVALGFFVSLIAPGVGVFLGYSMCVMGATMYMSFESYGVYKNNQLHLAQATLRQKNQNYYASLFKQTKGNFYVTLGKNLILPSIFLATFIMSWQVGLVLCSAYLALILCQKCLAYRSKTIPIIKNDVEILPTQLTVG